MWVTVEVILTLTLLTLLTILSTNIVIVSPYVTRFNLLYFIRCMGDSEGESDAEFEDANDYFDAEGDLDILQCESGVVVTHEDSLGAASPDGKLSANSYYVGTALG